MELSGGMAWTTADTTAWISATAAAVQAIGAVAAIWYTGKLARDAVTREKAANDAALERERRAEEASIARAEEAERRADERARHADDRERQTTVVKGGIALRQIIDELVDQRVPLIQVHASNPQNRATFAFDPPEDAMARLHDLQAATSDPKLALMLSEIIEGSKSIRRGNSAERLLPYVNSEVERLEDLNRRLHGFYL
jgi:hypothetical protein